MKKIILTIFILSIFQISFACDNEKQCIELALENKTDFKTALNYLNEAIKFNEQSEQAYYYRALLKFENGKRKSSLKDYDKLITKYPNNWIYHFNRAYVCYSLGQIFLKGAAVGFKDVYEFNRDSEIARINYGIAQDASDTYSETTVMFGPIAGAIGSKNRHPVEKLGIDLWAIFQSAENQKGFIDRNDED